MHITLSEAFIAQSNFDEAIDTLSKAQNIERRYNDFL